MSHDTSCLDGASNSPAKSQSLKAGHTVIKLDPLENVALWSLWSRDARASQEVERDWPVSTSCWCRLGVPLASSRLCSNHTPSYISQVRFFSGRKLTTVNACVSEESHIHTGYVRCQSSLMSNTPACLFPESYSVVILGDQAYSL